VLMEDSTVLRLFIVNGPECLLFSGAAQDLKRTISACLPLNCLLNHSFFLGDFQSSRFSCSWLNLLWRTLRFSALIKLTYSCLPRVAQRSARLRVLRMRVPRLGVPRLGVSPIGGLNCVIAQAISASFWSKSILSYSFLFGARLPR